MAAYPMPFASMVAQADPCSGAHTASSLLANFPGADQAAIIRCTGTISLGGAPDTGTYVIFAAVHKATLLLIYVATLNLPPSDASLEAQGELSLRRLP